MIAFENLRFMRLFKISRCWRQLKQKHGKVPNDQSRLLLNIIFFERHDFSLFFFNLLKKNEEITQFECITIHFFNGFRITSLFPNRFFIWKGLRCGLTIFFAKDQTKSFEVTSAIAPRGAANFSVFNFYQNRVCAWLWIIVVLFERDISKVISQNSVNDLTQIFRVVLEIALWECGKLFSF